VNGPVAKIRLTTVTEAARGLIGRSIYVGTFRRRLVVTSLDG
jgi:hypothetical protein